MFQQILLSITLILSHFSPGITKPAFLKKQTNNQQSRDQETQLQGDAFQPEESVNQDSDVTSVLDRFLKRPSVHHRTARSNWQCVSHTVWQKDDCRGRHVEIFHCKRQHTFCSLTSVPPCCKPVEGWPYSNFNCSKIPIGCQCSKNCPLN